MKQTFSRITAYLRAHPKVDFIMLAVGLALFVTIALLNADRASIWFDEAFSAYIVRFNYIEIAQFTATDVHPPFYYWVLKTWTLLFGSTDFALRSLSVLFGAGALTGAYLLSRRFFGRAVGGVTLLFLILSPMLIRYSDEARMYTLAALVVMAATAVLVKATNTNKRGWWVAYGVLVSLGMWTHYFTALAWVAHWVWRALVTKRRGDSFKKFLKKFFTKPWVLTHALAVGLFLPWLVVMARQLTIVQSAGFWIGPVSVDTPGNYLSNYFMYLDSDQSQGWFALVMLFVVGLVIALIPRTYKALNNAEKRKFLLISSLAWAMPLLLFLASMPPLRSSFVERYLVPALIALSIFLAVVLVVGSRRFRPVLRVVPVVLVSLMMVFGIFNVYKYGNYNKNSEIHITVRELVDSVKAVAQPGQPIVANSPWTFYEAIQYATDEHPIYFIDANTQYIYGSLDMLKDRDQFKITDLESFKNEHPVLWYIAFTDTADVAPFETQWNKLQTISYYDTLTSTSRYKATQYNVSGE